MDSLENTGDLPSAATIRLIPTSAPTALAASANGNRSARDMWRMSRALSNSNADVLLFPTIYSYVPVVSAAKKIVMMHDVIAEKFPVLTMSGRKARLFWKLKVAVGRRQADALATVSDFSRQCIVEHFGMDAKRVHVISEASDPVFRVLENVKLTPRLRAAGIAPGQRTIVYVGGFSPHKNLEALVAAFSNLSRRPSFSDARLVLVGEDRKEVFHSYAGTIRRQVNELGLTDKVIFTGYLPDEEVVVLLNLASVSVLPSLMEGFGLPALEAAACGCPVIATRESPLPALLGEGGLFFDPAKPDELESALVRALESETLRKKLAEAGKAAADKLTWDASAQQMLNLIRMVAAA